MGRLILGSVFISDCLALGGVLEVEGTSLLLLLLIPAKKVAAASTGRLCGKEGAAVMMWITTGNGLLDSLLEAERAVMTASAASCLVKLRFLLLTVVASDAVVISSKDWNMRNI